MNSQAPHQTASQGLLPPTQASAADPLAELKDIHLPADIGLWPPAWGWWLLLISAIVAVALLVFFIRRHRLRNAYRAQAIAELNTSAQQFGDNHNAEYLQALSVILRRTALSGFGSHFNASLKGAEFLQWLDAQCSTTQLQFSQGEGKALLLGPYQKSPEFNRAALHKLSILWIKEHRNQWQRTKKIQKNQRNSEAEHHA